MLSLCILVVL
uniref:Uncharacterized protein n=1 Tax=Rhizophora mucronata TaxID=61149 RepID=A0A2P2NSW8_RHIMU